MARQVTFERKNVYRDFDMNFNTNPLTEDIGVKKDVNAINQSIFNLIKTNFYERPFRPDIGSNITRILFEPADVITVADLRQAIRETITNYEPRVTLLDVSVIDRHELNAYTVNIRYSITTLEEPVEVDIVLERLR